jgi:hypothetical protein
VESREGHLRGFLARLSVSFERRVASFVITRRLRRLERGRGAVTGAPIP